MRASNIAGLGRRETLCPHAGSQRSWLASTILRIGIILAIFIVFPKLSDAPSAQTQPAQAGAQAQGSSTPQNAAPAASQPASPGVLSTYTLESGMDVLLLPIPGSDSVSTGIVFRGGADTQTSKTAGLYQILEQLLFRGTVTSPGEPEPAGAIDALGATATEGGVQMDRLSLSFLIPPDMVGQGLDTLAYLFSALRTETAFSDPRTIEEARNASLVSINQAFSDPTIIFESAMARKLFVSAPWRLDVLGADYIVNAANETSLRALASTWLVPNNAALVIAGDIQPEALRPMIEKAFSSWKKSPDPWKNPLSVFPKPGVTRPTLMVYPDPSVRPGEAMLEMRYRGPDAGSSRSPAAELWAEMASEPGSRLAQAIVKGLPKSASPSGITVNYRRSRNASWFTVSALVRLEAKTNAADIALNFKEIVRGSEMYAMKTNLSYFSAKQYEGAKTALLETRQAALSDPLKAGNLIADGWIMGGGAWLRSWEDRLQKVTSKDLSVFADEYFMKNLEIVSVRLDPSDYANRKKSFDAYGFELITPQKAFWWR